jgi:hypothetical protein
MGDILYFQPKEKSYESTNDETWEIANEVFSIVDINTYLIGDVLEKAHDEGDLDSLITSVSNNLLIQFLERMSKEEIIQTVRIGNVDKLKELFIACIRTHDGLKYIFQKSN